MLVGANYQREDMDMYSYNKGPFDSTYKRNIYSLYASFNWQMGQSDNLIFNARETWVRNINGTQYNYKTKKSTRSDNESMSKFTPEVQYIHKISDDSRLYAKAGKSFRIPELTKIYGSGAMVSQLNLKPEQVRILRLVIRKILIKQISGQPSSLSELKTQSIWFPGIRLMAIVYMIILMSETVVSRLKPVLGTMRTGAAE